MNHTPLNPLRCEWCVPDASQPDGRLFIRGWDFGGSGPIALLHHANGFCAATWALVAEHLVAHFRVIAMDARGHGDSDSGSTPDAQAWDYMTNDFVRVAEQVRDAAGVDRLAYGIGSSFGGIIAAAAQAQHGDLFERVAMLDPPLQPTPDLAARLKLKLPDTAFSTNRRRQQLVERTLARRAVWPSRDVVRDAWRNKQMFAAWVPRGFELYLAEALRDCADGQVELKCDPTVEANIYATTGTLDPLQFAPKVKVPLLLARATGGFADPEFFRALAGLFPKGHYQELPGGHLSPLEVPEACAAMLLSFALQADGRRSSPLSEG